MSTDEEVLCQVHLLGSVDDACSSCAGKKIYIEVETIFTYLPRQEYEDEDLLSKLLDEGPKSKTISNVFSIDRDELSESTLFGFLKAAGHPSEEWVVSRILLSIGRETSYNNSNLRFGIRLDAWKEMDDEADIDDDGDRMSADVDDEFDDDDDDRMSADEFDDDDEDDDMDYDDDDDDEFDDDDDDFTVLNLNPASKSSIEGLKRMRVEEGCVHNWCTICLDEIIVGSEATVMPSCSHLYHSCCIVNWLQRSNFCPLCRSEVA